MDPQVLEALKQLGLNAVPALDTSAQVQDPDQPKSGLFPHIEDNAALQETLAKEANPEFLDLAKDEMRGYLSDRSSTQAANQQGGQSDLVKAYLSRLSQGSQPDAGLASAQEQARKNRFSLHAFGPQPAGPNAAVAYQIAGIHGPETQTNYVDPDSPVKDYLTAKQAQNQNMDTDLSRLSRLAQIEKAEKGSAGKSSSAHDPAVARTLAGIYAQERTGLGQSKGAGLREEALKGTEAQREVKHPMDVQRLGLTERTVAAREKGLSLKDAAQADKEAQGMVPGATEQENRLTPIEKRDLTKMAGGYLSAKTVIGRIQGIMDKGALGRLTDQELDGELNALYHESPDAINRALNTVVLAGPRAAGLKAAIENPDNMKMLIINGLTDNGRTKGELKAILELLDSSIQEKAHTMGVTGYKPGSTSKPHVKSAAPGRPGSGTGTGDSPKSQSGKVTITDSSDGKSYALSMDKAGAFMTKHGKEMVNGKPRYSASDEGQ